MGFFCFCYYLYLNYVKQSSWRGNGTIHPSRTYGDSRMTPTNKLRWVKRTFKSNKVKSGKEEKHILQQWFQGETVIEGEHGEKKIISQKGEWRDIPTGVENEV